MTTWEKTPPPAGGATSEAARIREEFSKLKPGEWLRAKCDNMTEASKLRVKVYNALAKAGFSHKTRVVSEDGLAFVYLYRKGDL